MSRIEAHDRLSAVLARDERLLDVLVRASPTFEKLRARAMRGTFARLVTVEQAARVAGVDPAALVDRLNGALDLGGAPAEAIAPDASLRAPEPLPASFTEVPPARIVDVDVREDLRAGREPFARIIEAARGVPPDGVLRVRAIFEPAPLYAVFAKNGFAHATERLAADDWRVWFRRDAAPERGPSVEREATSTIADEDVLVLDVRELEPPEPMMRTLEALATLPRGKTLVQVNARVPQFLLPKLAERGFVYEIREQSADVVRLFIRHRDP